MEVKTQQEELLLVIVSSKILLVNYFHNYINYFVSSKFWLNIIIDANN